MKDPFLGLAFLSLDSPSQPYRYLTLREIERVEIEGRVKKMGTLKAAKSLGISPRKVQYKMKEYRGEA